MKKTAIILAALLAASAFAGMRAGNSDSKDTFFRKLNTFNSVVRELQTGYVDTIDAEELMDNAIGMMLYQLDPYTEYYPSGNQDEILALSAGSYAGIGSIISKRGDNVIIALLELSGAHRRPAPRRRDCGRRRRYSAPHHRYRRCVEASARTGGHQCAHRRCTPLDRPRFTAHF